MRSEIAAAAVLLIGMTLFSYGVWLAWHPGGYMVSGLLIGLPAFFILYGTSRTEGKQRS